MSAARALADAGARDESAGAGDGGVKMHGDGSGSAVTSTNERRAMKRSDEKVEETESCVAQPAQLAAGELAGREVAEAVSVARRELRLRPPNRARLGQVCATTELLRYGDATASVVSAG